MCDAHGLNISGPHKFESLQFFVSNIDETESVTVC